MPSYDFRCSSSGAVFEVRYSISEKLNAWAQQSGYAGMALGDTAADGGVERLATGAACRV